MVTLPNHQKWRDIRFTARDGLTIYARHYRAPAPSHRPVICIAGLTRNSRDFHDLACRLSEGHGARDVYAIDLRGRGLSDHDPDWRNYVVPIEALDVLDLICIEGIAGAHVIGTSRGGLIAMVMASQQPGALGSIVLNDIGPVIEQAGLLRISSYVGRIPLPASWSDATSMIKTGNARFFPKVTDAQWDEIARQWYNEKNGRPAPVYDGKLARTFSVKDGKVPPLWGPFAALGNRSLLVLRGALSDILSQATVDEMCRRHARSASVTVPNEGHAPLLKDEASTEAIRSFLLAADAEEPIAGRSFAEAG